MLTFVHVSIKRFNQSINQSLTPVTARLLLPVHLSPSPTQPGAQVHLKLPAELVQVAWLSQLWAPISHSLMSEQRRNVRLQTPLKTERGDGSDCV